MLCEKPFTEEYVIHNWIIKYEVCWFINATYIKIYILVQIHTYYAFTHSSVSGVQLVLVSVYSILTMSAVTFLYGMNHGDKSPFISMQYLTVNIEHVYVAIEMVLSIEIL